MTNVTYAGYEFDDLGSPLMTEQLLPRLNGVSVLDLGIGGGHAIVPLAISGMMITGVDISQDRLDFCMKAFKEVEMEEQLKVICSDALEFLEANTEKFNAVSMSDFLMFIPKTEGQKIVKLAYEALEPQGYIWVVALSTNNEVYFDLSRSVPIDTDTYMAYSHCNGSGPACFYHPNEIEEYLKSLGAKVVFSTEAENRAGAMVNIVLGQRMK